VERRHEWADHVERFGGLRASSDRIADLDAWGLARTRELLANPPPEPFVAS
jgi:alpha-galactosidase